MKEEDPWGILNPKEKLRSNKIKDKRKFHMEKYNEIENNPFKHTPADSSTSA